MKKISLEYCHVTPDTSWQKEIDDANLHAPRILEMMKEADVQKCIMIDDIHSKTPVTPELIEEIVKGLIVKPDCIYLESSFVIAAGNLVESINPEVVEQRSAEERIWLTKVHDSYNSTNDFLMSWKKRDGSVAFSCPTLVATSYLCRLGLLSTDIEPVYGSSLRPSNSILNILSSNYLQVESNAELLIKATYPEVLKKIEWYFY